MTDYASFFDAPPAPSTRIVELGSLAVPSGHIYCCDPFLSSEVGPLETAVSPGDYAVQMCSMLRPEWGWRVALARLVFSTHRVVQWREAVYVMNGERSSEFRVDAGLACFMDASTRDLLVRTVSALHVQGERANYYDDVLAPEFKKNADPANPSHAGDWAMHAPMAGHRGNVALFASGLGDGLYRAYWGLDVAGNPAMLVADFDLLTTPT